MQSLQMRLLATYFKLNDISMKHPYKNVQADKINIFSVITIFITLKLPNPNLSLSS